MGFTLSDLRTEIITKPRDKNPDLKNLIPAIKTEINKGHQFESQSQLTIFC